MSETDKALPFSSKKSLTIAAWSAGLICLLVFLQSLRCGFVNVDDAFYVEHNPLINGIDAASLQRLFTEPQQGAWLPLTIVSFAIDNFFWNGNPAGYHLTNILLHAANTVLVVLIAGRLLSHVDRASGLAMSGSRLYPALLLLAGLLFGVHPLRVESVTWVSERKDVLNGLFTFGSVLYYLKYLHRTSSPGENREGTVDYCISVVLFLLSLMSKQASVVLPAVLLVIDWYPLGRLRRGNLRRVAAEKVPYLILSLGLSFITITWASKNSMMISAADFPFYARLLVSGANVFDYCRYILFPVGIVPFFPIGETLDYTFGLKTAAVITLTVLALVVARKRPYCAAVWFSFLLPLLPVLAFTQSADDTAIASRYTYLPSAGPSIAAATLLTIGHQSGGRMWMLLRNGITVLAVSLLIVYGALTSRLIAVWKNSGTLWTRQIEIRPLGRAYVHRGLYYYSTGSYSAALQDFTAALHIARADNREEIFNIHAYRGEVLRAMGLYEEAIADLTAAINLSPYPQYYFLRGSALKEVGRLTEAAEDFRRGGSQTGPIGWHNTKYSQDK